MKNLSLFKTRTIVSLLCCVAVLGFALFVSNALSGEARAETLYLAPNGNDAWSGSLARPNVAKTDGPLATLAGARDKLRAGQAANQGAKRRVVIGGGTYPMTAPLVLSPADTGSVSSPISYEAAAGARPVFSGGRLLTGWTRGKDGVWTTQIPAVKSGDWNFEQLWINDRRATRARTPNAFYLYSPEAAQPENDPTRGDEATLNKRAFVARKDDIAALQQLSPAELKDVTIITYHSWETSRHHIAAIDWKSSTVVLANDTIWPLSGQTLARYQLENFRSAMDAPGEWFLERESGTLFYKPLPGEDMTKARVVAPVAESFVQIQGDAATDKLVSNIAFRGLTFRYGQYVLPPEGHADIQSEVTIPAAIMLDGARDISFENCEVSHIGIYGMWMRNGCQNIEVRQCLLSDLGAGGVKIGETEMRDLPQQTGNITLDNNIIHHGGRMHHGAVGVWIGQSADNKVTHNDVGDFPYTGISIGWRWGYAESLTKRNTIDFNRVHHIGQGVLSDLGAIYTLGPSQGTTISSNVIHDVYCYEYGGWGIYNDEGSSGITMENNLTYHTKSGGYRQHYGRDNVVRNNIFTLGEDEQVQRARVENFLALTFEKNIVYAEGKPIFGGDWNDKIVTRDNLYWDAQGRTFSRQALVARQATGQDLGSIAADPMFLDVKKLNFQLKANSPAKSIGFVPFDYSRAGVYGSPAWKNMAASAPMPKLQIAPPPPPPTLLAFDKDFESSALGSAPREATMYPEGKGESIAVANDAAASGKQSLKIVDVAGLQHDFNPHFFFTPHHAAGVTTTSFDIRIDEKTQMYHEWRDHAVQYKVGPSFRIADGQLTVAGAPLMDIPSGVFVHVEVAAKLGAQADGTWSLKVTLPGGETRNFDALKTQNADWNKLDWMGFVSYANTATTYFLDNLNLQNHQ